jgi:hypothetical protein
MAAPKVRPGWDNSKAALDALNQNQSPVTDTPRINPRIKRANTGAAIAIRKAKLQYPELTNAQIAKRVGCDPANVYRVLKRFLGNNNTTQDLQDYKEHKGDVWDSIAMRAVMSIDDSKLSKSSASQLMMVAGIAFDKSQLVRGQATQINVSVLVDLVAAAREIRDSGPKQP